MVRAALRARGMVLAARPRAAWRGRARAPPQAQAEDREGHDVPGGRNALRQDGEPAGVEHAPGRGRRDDRRARRVARGAGAHARVRPHDGAGGDAPRRPRLDALGQGRRVPRGRGRVPDAVRSHDERPRRAPCRSRARAGWCTRRGPRSMRAGWGRRARAPSGSACCPPRRGRPLQPARRPPG